MGRGGPHEYFAYQDEATFLTPPGTLARVFGMGQEVSNINVKHTLLETEELNENTLAKFAYGEFIGSYDVNFRMSNPWFNSLLFGDPTVTGVGPYTYKWASNGLVPKVAKSFTGESGFAGESANVQRQFLGSIIGNLRMGARLNDFVQCTTSCGIGKEPPTPGTTLIGSPPKDSLQHPFTFKHAKIEIPDASVLAEVQSFEMNFNPNIAYVKGMNDEYATSLFRGLMSMTGRFNLTGKDALWITRALARAELATASFYFSNGLTGVNERSLIYKFKDVGVDSHQTGSKPNEIKLEDVPLVFRNLQATDPIVAVNNTSAAPS